MNHVKRGDTIAHRAARGEAGEGGAEVQGDAGIGEVTAGIVEGVR